MESEVTSTPAAPEFDVLSKLLEEHPERFVSGSEDIRRAALSATQIVFDLALKSEPESRPHLAQLLSSLNPQDAPRTRSQTRAQNGNGKRSTSPSPERISNALKDTPLISLFVDDMNDEQIWEQLDLRAKTVCGMLQDAFGELEHGSSDTGSEDGETQRMLKVLQALENTGLRLGDLEDDDDTTLDEDGAFNQDSEGDDDDDYLDRSNDSEEEDYDAEDGPETDGLLDREEGITSLQDSTSSSEGETEDQPCSERDAGFSPEEYVLNDGFFNLSAFNAESEAAEATYTSRGALCKDSDGEDSDEDGEIDINMFAPVDNFEHFDEDDLEQNDGELYYKDFFDPPSKKRKRQPMSSGRVRFHEEVRVKEIKANTRRKLASTMDLLQIFPDSLAKRFGNKHALGENYEDDESSKDGDSTEDGASTGDDANMDMKGHETITRLKDDLFAEDEEQESEPLSTHEKRMAALRQDISRLEAENVGKKDWVLMGEASSRSRPQNSLLEEDLQFDRVMKAVPLVTEENVQALEDKIKARILEGRFDDVIRRRPVDDKPFLPSRLFELKDAKSTQSLAQIYEADYVAAQSGEAKIDDRDGKLKKEHEELEKLWEGICWKLDALCNVHFVPKQPKAVISTISNAPAVTLESALPTAKAVSTMLAPEEIFAPNPSNLVARSELTPTEKRALRNKQRRSMKKTRDILDKSVDKYAKMRGIRGVKKQKEEALKSVVKRGKGVTVLGKRDGLKKEPSRRKTR